MGRPWRASRSVVQHLSCATSHRKNLHFPGAQLFQIRSHAWPKLNCSLKKILICWFCWIFTWGWKAPYVYIFYVRLQWEIHDEIPKTKRYSTRALIGEVARTYEIHRCSLRASATVLFLIFLLATMECKWGAISMMRCPCSHLSSQKSVWVPSPTSITMAIAKNTLTCSCTWIENMPHGRCSSIF